MFLLGGGSKLFLLLKDLVEEGKTVETKCNGLIKVLSDFYSPKNYVLTERHDYFQDRRQHPDEEMSESITSLKRLHFQTHVQPDSRTIADCLVCACMH